MTTKEVAKAVELWAAANAGGGLTSSFDFPPEALSKALPIAIAEVQSKARSNAPPEFTERRYQQSTLRVWVVELTLLVSPDPAWTASHLLYDMVDALETALFRDSTLGGRVAFAQKEVDASFDPPEVEFSDGTVARQATFTMTIGEQAET